MEDMLGRFQGNLGNISSEIRTLQEQSQGMSIKLRNRKAFEERLGSFLDNVAISSNLIEGIVNSPVDESYLVIVSALMTVLQTSRVLHAAAAESDSAPGPIS